MANDAALLERISTDVSLFSPHERTFPSLHTANGCVLIWFPVERAANAVPLSEYHMRDRASRLGIRPLRSRQCPNLRQQLHFNKRKDSRVTARGQDAARTR